MLKALYIGTERGIRYYTAPSESKPDALPYEIQVTQSNHVFCSCQDFMQRHYRQYPTLSDSQWHCKHLKAVTGNCEDLSEFLKEDFMNRHAKHQPRETDTQFHCKHVRKSLDFLNASNDFEPSDFCKCGALLEEKPQPDGCGDYYLAWVCPRCEVTK